MELHEASTPGWRHSSRGRANGRAQREERRESRSGTHRGVPVPRDREGQVRVRRLLVDVGQLVEARVLAQRGQLRGGGARGGRRTAGERGRQRGGGGRGRGRGGRTFSFARSTREAGWSAWLATGSACGQGGGGRDQRVLSESRGCRARSGPPTHRLVVRAVFTVSLHLHVRVAVLLRRAARRPLGALSRCLRHPVGAAGGARVDARLVLGRTSRGVEPPLTRARWARRRVRAPAR